MLGPFEHFGALLNANLHAASKVAALTSETSQKLFALQAKTYMDVFADGIMLKRVSSLETDPSRLPAEGQGLMESGGTRGDSKWAEDGRDYQTIFH